MILQVVNLGKAQTQHTLRDINVITTIDLNRVIVNPCLRQERRQYLFCFHVLSGKDGHVPQGEWCPSGLICSLLRGSSITLWLMVQF